ncbi:MAG TPA: bifunctional diaminohydroxyphosphoribosylaminopyrimidine deaminase/5-amino-6-(5-phosphoribosylamino)uracil reductase, partial [Paenibacillaceae bacterium]|nr:bifunctional diaminohydroxyphosphoribosylaminopyrimidine deaminase/5-amino-6-(5-phosphoribosylamino)uracil reductase [Paenibacillaceae bacterium]
TPPCSDALIRNGVKRVVVASLDPNPLVAGRGITKLKEAGIEVVTGVLEEQSARLNEVFNTFITKQRPFVTVKTASTLDGKV